MIEVLKMTVLVTAVEPVGVEHVKILLWGGETLSGFLELLGMFARGFGFQRSEHFVSS
jgi:hypothetical protein